MSEDSIQMDESQNEAFETLADAEEAILSRWEDSEETPEEPDEEEGDTTEEDPEDSEDEVTEESSDEEDSEETEDPDEKDEPEAKYADDDAVVEYTVDGETKKVSVSELKRLAGQEAALTRKSQEAAELRKNYETNAMTALTVLQKMQEKAAERWKPYEGVDLFTASRELDPQEFDALRKDMAAADADMRFFNQEIQQFSQQVTEAQKEAIRAQAPESVRLLKERIPEWSNDLYNDIRGYAVDKGMDAETVNNLIDPSAIEIINKARLYDQAKKQSVGKVKEAKTRMAKKTLKSSHKAPSTKTTAAQARDRLAKSGDMDDAAALFLAKWTDSED